MLDEKAPSTTDERRAVEIDRPREVSASGEQIAFTQSAHPTVTMRGVLALRVSLLGTSSRGNHAVAWLDAARETEQDRPTFRPDLRGIFTQLPQRMFHRANPPAQHAVLACAVPPPNQIRHDVVGVRLVESDRCAEIVVGGKLPVLDPPANQRVQNTRGSRR
jgi:hypothetical protein